MSRVDVQQSIVLERIIARLRSALKLNDRQVYETLSEDFLPRIPVGGEYFVAVSLADGVFPEEEQVPGNITEDSGVSVTAYTRIKLDSTDHAEEILRNARRGLLPIKRKILAALVGQDLMTEEGDTFLRQVLFARSCTRPQVKEMPDNRATIGVITIDFGVSFDWDLGMSATAEDESEG